MASFLIIFVLIHAADQNQTVHPNLTGIKCVVSGKQASEKYFAKYKQGRIYFDCNASRLQFEVGELEYIKKANHQLVVSRQYLQAKCPIKNVPLLESTENLQLMGVHLQFCCPLCKTEFLALGDSIEMANFLFSKRNFDKTFVAVNEKSAIVQRAKPGNAVR